MRLIRFKKSLFIRVLPNNKAGFSRSRKYRTVMARYLQLRFVSLSSEQIVPSLRRDRSNFILKRNETQQKQK